MQWPISLLAAMAMAIIALAQQASAICHNATWVACVEDALAIYEGAKADFGASSGATEDIKLFYCNSTVTYYQEFAHCTTTYDCWNFPSAVSLRNSKYNITDCTSVGVQAILGGTAANCPTMSCDDLLPGSQKQTFAPRSSDSNMASTGALAALGLLAGSLLF